jgi:hypothetical protein
MGMTIPYEETLKLSIDNSMQGMAFESRSKKAKREQEITEMPDLIASFGPGLDRSGDILPAPPPPIS